RALLGRSPGRRAGAIRPCPLTRRASGGFGACPLCAGSTQPTRAEPMTRMFAISGVSAAALACGAAAAPAIPSFAEREPEIDFPVCVGLARIEGGAVTEIPVSEAV